MSTLAQQALNVYCDEVVRDAVVERDSLREENAKLEPIRENLLSVHVKANGKAVTEFNLLETDDEDEGDEFWAYKITDAASLPYEQIKVMSISISGVALITSLITSHEAFPKLTVLTGAEIPTIEIVILHTDYVKVTGVVTHLSGSLDEAQNMIDDNRHLVYFMGMGLVSERTGQPLPDLFDNNPFRGALFTLKKIEILKRLTEPAILCNESTCDTTLNAEQNRELVSLAESNEAHEGLVRVTKELKSLLDCRFALSQSRDLYQRVEARYWHDGSSNCIQFKLDTGRLFLTSEGKNEFIIEPLADEDCTIPISSIVDMKIFLANVPWDMRPIHVAQPVFVHAPPGLMLRYSDGIEATFLFDQSFMDMNTHNIQGGLVNYIMAALFQNRGGRAGEDAPEAASQLTMKLLGLQIDFSQVQSRLDLLGVDY
jgi:hypothetical protein